MKFNQILLQDNIIFSVIIICTKILILFKVTHQVINYTDFINRQIFLKCNLCKLNPV